MIMTNDPSLTAWGWSIVDEQMDEVIDSGCIKTSSQSNEKKMDDDPRRVRVLSRDLFELVEKYEPNLLLTEFLYGGQSIRSAKTSGFCISIIECLSMYTDTPCEWFTERNCKKVLFGRRSVSKGEMREHVRDQLDVDWTDVKYRDEAIADSLSIYLTAKEESDMLNVLAQGGSS